MSNLIVTILAIGLASVIALMGAYYGGNSFLSGQGRANATKHINYMTQISGAMNLWSQKNGGVMPRPSTSFPSACTNAAYCNVSNVQTMLGSRYLATTALPDGADGGFLYYFNEASSAMQNPVLLLRLGASAGDKNTCVMAETLRQNTAPTNLRVYNGGTANINRYMCGNTGCFQNDGTFGATGTYLYVMYFRLRGMPNTSLTDFPGPVCPES